MLRQFFCNLEILSCIWDLQGWETVAMAVDLEMLENPQHANQETEETG